MKLLISIDMNTKAFNAHPVEEVVCILSRYVRHIEVGYDVSDNENGNGFFICFKYLCGPAVPQFTWKFHVSR